MDVRPPTRGWVFWVLAVCVGFAVWSASPSARAEEPEVPTYKAPESLAVEPGLPELPACAVAPAPYEGEDQVVGELRALRSETAEMCAAITGRQEAQLRRLWWVTAQLLDGQHQEHVDLQALLVPFETPLPVLVQNTEPLGVEDQGGYVWLKKLSEQGEGTQAVSVENPDPISVSDVEALGGLERTQEATEVGSKVSNTGTWILVGCLIGGFFVFLIWRAWGVDRP